MTAIRTDAFSKLNQPLVLFPLSLGIGSRHARPFKALLQSRPDPVTADKIADLQNMFRDAYTGWLEIENEAA